MSYASTEKLHTLEQKIEQRMKHAFLEKHIKKPEIDQDKLLLIHTIIGQTELPQRLKEQYAVTSMLVQIALDTHDHVVLATDPDEKSSERVIRQLTVLAGNYYSALYYQLLSEVDDIHMIHVLSTAIKEINEKKMSLYYGEAADEQALINGLKEVEALLPARLIEELLHEELPEACKQLLLYSTLRKVLLSDDTANSPFWKSLNEMTMFDGDSAKGVIRSSMTAIHDSLLREPALPKDWQLVQERLIEITAQTKQEQFYLEEG